MKKLTSILLLTCILATLLFTGCSSDGDAQTFASAVDALNAVWNNYDENLKFPCYGGTFEKSVDNAPGTFPLSDTASAGNIILNDKLLGQVSDAASLFHMMNANTFTGVAVKVTGDKSAFVSNLKSAILGFQFVCGAPEKLCIITVGDYVIYSFGFSDIVDPFETAAKKIKGAKVEVSQLF